MLDYWALACTLDEREISRPVIKYHGIDAIKWDHSLGAEVRDKDKKTFKFSQESFKNFFERQDNRFIYLKWKRTQSISVFLCGRQKKGCLIVM